MTSSWMTKTYMYMYTVYKCHIVSELKTSELQLLGLDHMWKYSEVPLPVK